MVGLAGSGCDVELKILSETEKNYRVKVVPTGEELWFPKSAFDESGALQDWADNLFAEKMGRCKWPQE
jgi:hypothetical protein